MISDNAKQCIDDWIKKYPTGKQQSAVMEALKIVQAENGNSLTPESIKAVAIYLDMPVISVMEVASFYENYNHQETAKHQIRFCHNISCMLNGADDLIIYTQKKVENNPLISVKKVECLGACVGAPMFQIGDRYFENLTQQKIDKIVGDLK
jgi:NADH-quinone oxidoreductase subunit E